RPLLVATGCLVERAGGAPELADFLAAADARAGFADYPRLPETCRKLLAGQALATRSRGYAGKTLPKTYLDWLSRPRMRIGSAATAYVKIGEGCSNGCAYCSIPLIRGRRASRPLRAILKEARDLVAAGAKELVLIAQDTTAYGLDRADEPQLARLLRELGKLPGELWFRVMYAHPRHLTDEILEALAADPRFCPYLDLPLQHVNEKILKRMGRGYGRARVDAALDALDRRWPGAALRTTFIVGHPGEGEKEFAELLEFVEAGRCDHAGVFAWSPEPGTVSAGMADRVPAALAAERRDRLLAAQAKVSAARLRARKGVRTTLLLERRDAAGWHGRTPWQAPDVDGETVLEDAGRDARAGDFAQVKIVRTGAYDCRARRRPA
ncbi:MAG: MiaB/RimO family radical SAM methylthiotransferase, partial [Kiritimatiellia bacterium]